MPVIPELDRQLQKDYTTFEASQVYTVKIQVTKVYSETLSPKTENKNQQDQN